MAIDSARKRASALGAGLIFATLVIPSGAIDQPDRQTIASCYSGITAAVPVIDTEDCAFAGVGTVTDVFAAVGPINADAVAANGLINDAPVAKIGTINPSKAGIGTINAAAVAGIGTITDVAAFEGEICDC